MKNWAKDDEYYYRMTKYNNWEIFDRDLKNMFLFVDNSTIEYKLKNKLAELCKCPILNQKNSGLSELVLSHD